MYFTLYPMLFLEDQLKTQELCPTSQSTIAVEANLKEIRRMLFLSFGPRVGDQKIEKMLSEETMAVRHGKSWSLKDALLEKCWRYGKI